MKNARLVVEILLFGCVILNFNITSFAQENRSEGRVLIGFKDGIGHQNAERHKTWAREFGGTVRYSYRFLPVVAARLSKMQISRLRNDPRVDYIEEDGKVYALDTELSNSWGVEHIGADNVHLYNKGAGIKVAIIDTGIDYKHPDLSANYHGGYDFFNDDSNPMDDHGHGTHCAGIVAALDNGTGVVGVAPEASIYAVKVLDASGSGYTSDLVAGIEWAIENKMQVISMSLGTNSNYQTLRNACDDAYAAGIFLVAAAGNDYRGVGRWELDTVDYPAKYDSVIAVGATDKNNKKASWSSTGPALEMAAPGVSIYSTYINGGYATMSGTSMACPHVAGTIALILAGSNGDVRSTLKNTADDLGNAGWDQWYGYGLVNAEEAAGIPADMPPTINITAPLDGDTVSGTVTITSDAHDDNGVAKIDFYCGSTLIGTDYTSPYSFDWDSTVAGDGIYTITATATDTAYKTASDSINVVIDNINDPPVANAGVDKTVSDSDSDGVESVTLDGSGSYDPDGTISSYKWTEDGSILGTDKIISYDFAVGTHTITLTVTDNEGASVSDDCIITILANKPPVANAGPDQSAYVNEIVNFDGSGSYDPDGSIISYDWDFGDSSTETGEIVSHAYSVAGIYTVTLIVMDNGGATDSDTLMVNVSETPKTEQFTFTGTVPKQKENNHPVSIKAGADNMYIKLTWNSWDDLRLRVYNPYGTMVAEVDRSNYRNRVEEITIETPVEREWQVAAYSESRWSSINYRIEVVVNY